jgi:hypothetical protein
VLDLLACVHDRQGDLDRADRCWAETEQLPPAPPVVRIARGVCRRQKYPAVMVPSPMSAI